MKHTTLLASALFFASPIFAADAPPVDSSRAGTPAAKRILFVLTSHDRKGDTGKPTGFSLAAKFRVLMLDIEGDMEFGTLALVSLTWK